MHFLVGERCAISSAEDAVSEEASQEGYQSPDSESWDAKKGSRRGQR